MATEVGKLIVKIEADLKNLRSGLRRANAIAGESGATMQKSANRMQSALRKTGGVAKGLAGSLFNLKTALAGVVTGVAVKGIFDVNARFQDLESSMKAVLGGAEEASAGMDFVREFALNTPFEVDTLTSAFTQLANAGIKPTKELLTTFSDSASTTVDKVRAFETQVRIATRSTQGGLGLEELNQLADSGIPVFDILQERLGKTRLELSEFGQTSEGASKIMKELNAGLSERFGGAGEDVAKNLNVVFGNMIEKFQEMALAIGEGGLNDALLNLFGVLENVAVTGMAFSKIIGRLAGELINVLAYAIDVAVNSLADMTRKLIAFLNLIGEKFGIKALRDFGSSIRETNQPMVEQKKNTEELLKVATKNIKVKKQEKKVSDDYKDTLKSLNEELKSITLSQSGFSDSLIEAMSGAGLLEKSIPQLLMPDDATAKAIENLRKLTEKIDLMTASIEATVEEQEALDTALSDLTDEGVGFAEGLDTIENNANKLMQTQKAVNFAFAQGKITSSQYRDAMKEIHRELEALDPVQSAITEGIDNVVNSASDNFAKVLSGMKSFSEGFKDIFQGVVKEVINQVMKLMVIQPLVNLLTQAIGNITGSFFSQAPAPIVTATRVQVTRAGGGTVQARTPTLVGERGAELFVPNTGGRIMNHQDTNSATRGGSVTVNQSLNFATGIQNTVRAEVLNLVPDIIEATKFAIADGKQRGGSFGQALG